MTTEIQKEATRLMESVTTVYLTTTDTSGFPSTRAMLNLRNPGLYPQLTDEHAALPDPLGVYLTTNTSSEKMSEIASDDRACLYFCDPGNFTGATLQGRIEVITDTAFKQRIWRSSWEMYYPGGVGSPDFTMLLFIPEQVKLYHDLSVTKESLTAR